jgi:DNA uptake protein ComE-like DNA-binding protein
MHAIQREKNTSPSSPLTLTGPCGYEIQGDRIVITIGKIANDRDLGNISGTLAIEVWALDQPYTGGGFTGTPLCSTSIGEIFGQHFLIDCRYDLIFQEPPAGTWWLTLMLREWSAAGYVTCDYLNFALPYVVEAKPTVVRSDTDNVINVEFASSRKSPAVSAEAKSPPPAAKKPVARTTHANQPEPQHNSAVSLNESTHKEIAGVKGISKKVAENIVAARPFESVDDVLKVKGVGAKLLKSIRQFIKL